MNINDLGAMAMSSGADFTKGLKPRFTLKFKILVLHFVNRMVKSVVLDLTDFTKQLSP